MWDLIQEGKQVALSEEKQNELNKLMDIADFQVLMRSKALVILKERGHDIDSYLKRDK